MNPRSTYNTRRPMEIWTPKRAILVWYSRNDYWHTDLLVTIDKGTWESLLTKISRSKSFFRAHWHNYLSKAWRQKTCFDTTDIFNARKADCPYPRVPANKGQMHKIKTFGSWIGLKMPLKKRQKKPCSDYAILQYMHEVGLRISNSPDHLIRDCSLTSLIKIIVKSDECT